MLGKRNKIADSILDGMHAVEMQKGMTNLEATARQAARSIGEFGIDLDHAKKAEKEKRKLTQQHKAWRRHRFADVPIVTVGSDDAILQRLQEANKQGNLMPMQVEEMIFRMELQKERKKAKRAKAKQKRQNKRYNRNFRKGKN